LRQIFDSDGSHGSNLCADVACDALLAPTISDGRRRVQVSRVNQQIAAALLSDTRQTRAARSPRTRAKKLFSVQFQPLDPSRTRLARR